MSDMFNLQRLSMPRIRKIPKNIDESGSTNFIPSNVCDCFRPEYYKIYGCLQNLDEYLFANNDIEKVSRKCVVEK